MHNIFLLFRASLVGNDLPKRPHQTQKFNLFREHKNREASCRQPRHLKIHPDFRRQYNARRAQ